MVERDQILGCGGENTDGETVRDGFCSACPCEPISSLLGLGFYISEMRGLG